MTTDVAEAPPVEQLDDVASTPAPEALAEPTPPGEPLAAPQGEETPVPVAPKPVSALAPQEQEAELQSLVTKGNTTGLSSDEIRRYQALNGAVFQRNEAQRRQMQELEDAEQNRLQELQTTFETQRQTAFEKVKTEIDRAFDVGRPPDYGLIEEYLQGTFTAAQQKSGEVHLAPVHKWLDKAIFQSGEYANTPQNRRALAAWSVDDKLATLMTVANKFGRLTGPDESYKVMSPADLAAHDKEVLDNFKSANPGAFSPDVRGGNIPAGGFTLAQIDAMATHEWMALGDRETRQRILDDAHRMAGR